ncbi:MAG TPA: trypsin-like peptidase domain-containing protein [Beijerinckiaceae bacterium]|nr:trypsin-like peptidase domain-containing protein [Beijerinckiaceae bacterium]
MIGSRLLGRVSLLVASLSLTSAAFAAPAMMVLPRHAGAIRPIHVVVFGKNGRETVAQFAAGEHEDPATLHRDYAASGIVRCGRAHGAGQLTLADNVITTAAHVFFDEAGRQRAASCRFEVMRGDATVSVSINMKSIVAGSRNPYSIAAVHDWAVARLDMPILDATPYQIANTPAINDRVRFVARGHIDWGDARRLSVEACRLRRQTNSSRQGPREFSFDCDTGDGASGGAVLLGNEPGKLCAVLVGYRSIDPTAALPFSPLHYNFVVSIEGDFREAAIDMAHPRVAAADNSAQE